MIDVIDDVSKLSSIPDKALNKLVILAMFSILEGLQEMAIQGQPSCEFDIGLGILILNTENNLIKFKFKPSAKLSENIINTLRNKENSLMVDFENSFVKKIESLYKELI